MKFKEEGTGDAKFTGRFCFDDFRDDDAVDEKMAMGGDPTLSVSVLPRNHTDPLEELGFARAVLADEDDYGVGKIDNVWTDMNSPPGDPSWAKFGALMQYFTMEDELQGTDMADPATYAAFIGIEEAPLAVVLRTAWCNGCNLVALLCSENHVYLVSHSNG